MNNLKIKLNQKEMAISGLRYHFSPFIITLQEVVELYKNISSYVDVYDIARAQSKEDELFGIDGFINGSLYLSIRETETNDNGKDILIAYNEGEEFFQTFVCVVGAFMQNQKNENHFTPLKTATFA